MWVVMAVHPAISGLLALLCALQCACMQPNAATVLSWLAAFHPVNALLIFALTFACAQRARHTR